MEGFATTRVRVKHWRTVLGDADLRAALKTDLAAVLTPPVLRHLPPPLQLQDMADVGDWIDARAAESDVYLVYAREDEGILGLLILAQTEKATIHLGYLLAETAWGKGYATEIVQGLVGALDAGTTLTGGVGIDNPGSAKVLLKAGFQLDPAQSTPETNIYAFTST